MLNFEFTDEQNMMKETVREFGKKEIEPIVRNMENDGQIPDKVIKGLAELGLLGITASQHYGGIEADPITVGVIAEELARADISCAIPTFYLVQAAWGYVLNKYGNDETKKAIFPNVTQGSAFLGIGSTEPDAGSDVARIRTTAKKSGDIYVLNGEKMFISGPGEVRDQLPRGGGYLTLAKTDVKAPGAKGISMFFVPLAKDTKGVSYTILEDWGRRGISTGGYAMENVEIPKDYLVGEENKGFYIAMEGFEYARAIISVVSCGAAMSALTHAMEYMKTRKAFGHAIGKFEGVQFKLAEHWAKLDAIRLLGYKALWMLDKYHKKEAFNRFDIARITSEAKLLAPVAAFDAVNDAVQWFGAFGYTTECPLDLALRGVRSYYWAEGALEIQKIIIARELLGKEFVAYR